jgi:hypothetical protein
VAKKETTSDWWKQVIERRKGQATGEGPPAEGDHPKDADSDAQAEPTVPPTPEMPPEALSQEEQIDQVSAPAAERNHSTTWPPPTPLKPGVGSIHTPEPPKPPIPGANRVPKDLLAYLILIDIGGEMRQARQFPQYFQIQRLRTLAGRHAKAHIHLDDEATVRPEHAKIIYQEREDRWFFTIHPLPPGAVTVNETPVAEEGVVLKSGDLVGIGSAKLVFFMKSLRDGDL